MGPYPSSLCAPIRNGFWHSLHDSLHGLLHGFLHGLHGLNDLHGFLHGSLHGSLHGLLHGASHGLLHGLWLGLHGWHDFCMALAWLLDASVTPTTACDSDGSSEDRLRHQLVDIQVCTHGDGVQTWAR